MSNIGYTARQPSTWLGVSQALKARKLEKELNKQGGLQGQLMKEYRVSEALANKQREMAGEQFDYTSNIASQIGSMGIPEESKQYEQDLIEQGTQTGLRTASGMGGLQDAISQISGGQFSAYRDLASRDAMARQQNKQQQLSMLDAAKQRELQALGQADTLQYGAGMDMLKGMFYPKLQEMQALKGAAIQNTMEGFNAGQQNKEQDIQTLLSLAKLASGK
jgi:hypothetical protein